MLLNCALQPCLTGPEVRAPIYMIEKTVFPGEGAWALHQKNFLAMSVKPRAQEQTLIPLTVLFMPGQPELTFLTCLCRFLFTLPPRSRSLTDLPVGRLKHFALNLVTLNLHRWDWSVYLGLLHCGGTQYSLAFLCLLLLKRHTDPLERN